jgi:hypothetical protein
VPDLVQELIVACNGKEITSIYLLRGEIVVAVPDLQTPYPPSSFNLRHSTELQIQWRRSGLKSGGGDESMASA